MSFHSDPRFWIYVLTLIPFALCTIWYGLRSPWQESRVGRSLMALYASITAVLLFAVIALSEVFDEATRNLLRLVFLGGVGVAGWIQFVNILHYQRQDRRCADSTPEERP